MEDLNMINGSALQDVENKTRSFGESTFVQVTFPFFNFPWNFCPFSRWLGRALQPCVCGRPSSSPVIRSTRYHNSVVPCKTHTTGRLPVKVWMLSHWIKIHSFFDGVMIFNVLADMTLLCSTYDSTQTRLNSGGLSGFSSLCLCKILMNVFALCRRECRLSLHVLYTETWENLCYWLKICLWWSFTFWYGFHNFRD